jgi:signal transduction histidine kinase
MANNPKAIQASLDFRAVLDGLGQGVLLFDSDDHLVLDNLAARAILGPNLVLVRSEGWSACAMLLDARRLDGPTANEVRAQALRQADPVRFHTLLAGAYTPCWAAAIYGSGGKVFTMITLERPDWKALNELMSTFRDEARMAISSTRGHAELIMQMLRKAPPGMTIDQLAQRISGFAEIMATHMHRLQMLMALLYRLEIIRTGQLPANVRSGNKKIALADFVEDFLEELVDEALIDPSQTDDLRERLIVNISSTLAVSASPTHLADILRDLLRNAVLYSPKGAPIMLRAMKMQQGSAVQIDVIDQGYGIRAKEADRIFAPFQRSRQPQIIGEFGYGLSLYLAKAEIEAMGGRIWYESEEGVGSTFSIKLPAWRDVSDTDA